MTDDHRAAWGFLASVATPEQIKIWQSWPAERFTIWLKQQKKALKGKQAKPLEDYKVTVTQTYEMHRRGDVVVAAYDYNHAITLARTLVEGGALVNKWSDFGQPMPAHGYTYRASRQS